MTAVLLIGGLDSSGGAGLSRDISTLTDLGVDALCVATAITAQTNSKVIETHHVPAQVISAQIRSAFATRQIAAIKIGMLGTAASVQAIADGLVTHANRTPIVLDPVLAASSGGMLLDGDGREALRTQLFPLATLVTPNLPEAAALLGYEVATTEDSVIAQAQQLLAWGPTAILMKGGHGAGNHSVDDLVVRSGITLRFALPRVQATQRGTGCALASAIAAGIASGATLENACYNAKQYVHQRIKAQIAPNSSVPGSAIQSQTVM